MIIDEQPTSYEKFTITQLIYLNEGGEQDFLKYESIVLPLLEKYNGRLEFRIRPGSGSFLHPDPKENELPYEIHVVSFGSIADFEKYKHDPSRIENLGLFEKAVKKVLVLESAARNDHQ